MNVFACRPCLALKKITDPHVFAHVNTECLDNRYKKLKMCISEQYLGSSKFIPVAYVKINYMILP